MQNLLAALTSLFSPLSPLGVSIGIWILVMINVPVIRWVIGPGAERIGISAGVLAQVAVVVIVLAQSIGWWSLLPIAVVPALGWASEAIGSRTGIPFGEYRYTEVLQPQIAHVPVLIPLAWLMMMPPAWAVGAALSPDSLIGGWIVAAAAFTAWDLYLDPQMVKWDFWRWKKEGAYLGIPVSNYVGWFVVSFAITAALSLLSRLFGFSLETELRQEPLVIVFLITWLLQFIGQLFFWKLRISAVVGFVAMGLFAAALAFAL
jgi:putative membrane protein